MKKKKKGKKSHSMNIIVPKVKAILFASIFFVGLPSLVTFIMSFGNWSSLWGIVIMGSFLSLVAAPEIEPHAFKKRWLFQLLGGLLFGLTLGIVLRLDVNVIFLSSSIGAFVGVTTPFWLKYAPIPS